MCVLLEWGELLSPHLLILELASVQPVLVLPAHFDSKVNILDQEKLGFPFLLLVLAIYKSMPEVHDIAIPGAHGIAMSEVYVVAISAHYIVLLDDVVDVKNVPYTAH